MGSIYYDASKIVRSSQEPCRLLRVSCGENLKLIERRIKEDVADGDCETIAMETRSIIINHPWKDDQQYTMNFPIKSFGLRHCVAEPNGSPGFDSLEKMLLMTDDEIFMVNKKPVLGQPIEDLQKVFKEMWIKTNPKCLPRPLLKKSTSLEMIIGRLENETLTYITICLTLKRGEAILKNAQQHGTREVTLSVYLFDRIISVDQQDDMQISQHMGAKNLTRTVYKMRNFLNVKYLAVFHYGQRCLVSNQPDSDRVELKKVLHTTNKKLHNGQHIFIIRDLGAFAMYESYVNEGYFLSFNSDNETLNLGRFALKSENRPPDHMQFKIE